MFYLPANDEAHWHEEVAGIDGDAALIFFQASPNLPSMFGWEMLICSLRH